MTYLTFSLLKKLSTIDDSKNCQVCHEIKLLHKTINFLQCINNFLIYKIGIANDIIISDSDTTQPTWQNTNYGLPYFDNTTKRDIIATVGSAAKLQCVVRNLGDRAVSIKDEFARDGNLIFSRKFLF